MKNTAVVERDMHERIAQNFDAGYSPADPDHYQAVYSWGRKLSGRAAAAHRLTKSLGTVDTTNELPATKANIVGAASELADFIRQLGAQVARPTSEFPLYGSFPLWERIPKDFIRQRIENMLGFYPEGSRRSLRSLAQKIEESHDPAANEWYFTIGIPDRGAGKEYTFATDGGGTLTIRSGNPSSAEVRDGLVHTQNIRNYLAFYSMVPTRFILRTDAAFLRENARTIAKIMDGRRDPATGAYPPSVEKALKAFQQQTTEQKLMALADAIDAAGGRVDPKDFAPVHDYLPEGIRNRSATKYRERVYSLFHDETGLPRNPILQAYLVTPPQGLDTDSKPLISWSFYWPDLTPDVFHLVSIGF